MKLNTYEILTNTSYTYYSHAVNEKEALLKSISALMHDGQDYNNIVSVKNIDTDECWLFGGIEVNLNVVE